MFSTHFFVVVHYTFIINNDFWRQSLALTCLPKEILHLILSTLNHWVEIALSWCQTGSQKPSCNRQPDHSALLRCIIYGPWQLPATLHCIMQVLHLWSTTGGEIDFLKYRSYLIRKKGNKSYVYSTRVL